MLLKAQATTDEERGFLVRKSKKAKRVSLRVNTKLRVIELVVPTRVSIAWALQFADTQKDWIAKHKDQFEELIPMPAHEAKALRKQAREVLTALVNEKLKLLPTTKRGKALPPRQGLFDFFALAPRWEDFVKIRIGDPKTRWGSCHPDGNISLSWRLMLAPEAARDYVVAHEVAHLIHNNHKRGFWELCRELSLDFEAGHGWMKTHGHSLHNYTVAA